MKAPGPVSLLLLFAVLMLSGTRGEEQQPATIEASGRNEYLLLEHVWVVQDRLVTNSTIQGAVPDDRESLQFNNLTVVLQPMKDPPPGEAARSKKLLLVANPTSFTKNW